MEWGSTNLFLKKKSMNHYHAEHFIENNFYA